MITKEVVVDQIELTASRIIQIRFRKNIVEDGKLLSYEYHRTSLSPGTTLADQMKLVNAHLQQMGWPPCADTKRIEAIVKAEHTPEVVKAYRVEHSLSKKKR